MAKSICFFNHKGGVSKTTTTFNIGWCLAEKGYRVMIVDLDSQCNLTGLVLGQTSIDEDKMEQFYASRENLTMEPIVESLLDGDRPDSFMNSDRGKLFQTSNETLFLLPGSIRVSDLDSQISIAMKISKGVPAVKNIPGNLPKVFNIVAEKNNIDYVLYDLSPNVGGLNQVALMSSDYFIVPASPDFFCWQSINSLTTKIIEWNQEISYFKKENGFISREYPLKNNPKFIGLIQQRYRPRKEKPAKSFEKWIDKIREEVNNRLIPKLSEIDCVIDRKLFDEVIKNTELSPYDLVHIPDFNSLIAISQQLSKPIFVLTDEDVRSVGKVFGHAFETMKASRDSFLTTFVQLTERVIKLTS